MSEENKNTKLSIDQELQIIIDIHKSLTNITSSLSSFKETVNDLIKMEQKHGLDLQILNERLKFLNEIYEKISPIVSDTQTKINVLTTQIDFKERMDIIKNKTHKKHNFLKDVMLVLKNSKWIAIALTTMLLLLTLVFGGMSMFEKQLKFLASTFWWF